MEVRMNEGKCDGQAMERRPGMIEKLRREREMAEKRLAQISRALNVLEANPVLAEALDSIDSLGRLF
jgi:hypothetical protein